jgi:adenine-specific DNA-methyltransferase
MVNADKPHLWKADVARSVDFYNDWFMRFAPDAYREKRIETIKEVEVALIQTDFLRNITPFLLKEHPSALSMLRMATAPPIARDRLIGLAYVSSNLVYSMEGKVDKPPRIPPRMDKTQLEEELTRICEIIQELADRDICTWLESGEEPEREQISRASSIIADRLCGVTADPIIRNAQEKRQLHAIRTWLEAHEYSYASSNSILSVKEMTPGMFAFIYNVPVSSGKKQVNIAVDCVILPHTAKPGDLPIFIEAKSAGDFTNTNKRRKEEAQKANQLRKEYGKDVQFILFLCGYFDTPYLGYEAAEGIDWIWEHRIDDFVLLGLTDKPQSEGRSSGDESIPQVKEGSPHDYGIPDYEQQRLEIQKSLDAQKTQEERNKLGQFATPGVLALEMANYAYQLIDIKGQINFLEPALGTGAFFSAVKRTFSNNTLYRCFGIEVDSHYGVPAQELWGGRNCTVTIADFTEFPAPTSEKKRFDLLLTNPPYVRHHHLTAKKKRKLREAVQRSLLISPGGLSGFYTYFMYLAHDWLREGSIAGWLIPGEFMSVNYGKTLREYLLKHVTLLHIHRFDPVDVQFDDALVSSTIVWYKKEKPSHDHEVLFTYGGTLLQPKRSHRILINELRNLLKWHSVFTEAEGKISEAQVRVGDLFTIKRGIATGANKFFILPIEEAEKFQLPREFLIPILPSPRFITDDIIEADSDGMPAIRKKLVLLSCNLPSERVKNEYPALWKYLQKGIRQKLNEGYLCRNRTPWYAQEHREPAPFLCSYMGRSTTTQENPFHFMLNKSKAVTPNVYLNLYPKPVLAKALKENSELAMKILQALSNIDVNVLQSNGRTYGGGLQKLEPKELANVPLKGLPEKLFRKQPVQYTLF